jgi:hypothetical protein
MIKLNDRATENEKGVHNHSHSNLSLLSEEKSPLRFPKGIESISPVNAKNYDMLFLSKLTKSPAKSHNATEIVKKKFKRKANPKRKLHDNLTSASTIPKPLYGRLII